MHKIKRYHLLVFLVISLGNSIAQTYNISGTVKNSETKFPVYNVNVFIVNTDVGASTDTEGKFYIVFDEGVIKEKQISIRMIGYKELIIPLDTSKLIICPGCLSQNIDLGEIFISTKSLELDSIHIHAHHNESDQISNISLSGEKLYNNLRGNIATTLSNQPNIGLSSLGVVTSKPVLRGFSSDRILLTKNGSEMGDLSQISIDHAITLEIAEVKEIEIIRGPKSLIYGPNAIGGVINTSTTGDPKVRFEKFQSKVTLGGESFNRGAYGNLILYIPIENNQLNISINKSSTQNQTSPIGELENTQSNATNYKLGITRYYQNSYINCIVENYNMDYGIPPSEEGHINGVDIVLIKNTFQLNYHHDISFFNMNQFDIKYNFIDYRHGEYESDYDFRSVGLANKTHNGKFEMKSNHSILGSDFQIKQFSAEGFYWTPKTVELDMSIYGYLEKELANYDIMSSIRIGYLSIQPRKPMMKFSNLERNRVTNKQFAYYSSSIGIKRQLDHFEFGSWIMNTMRAPALEELYSDGPHLGTYSYEIGNPDLDLEKLIGIESSIIYRISPFSTSLTTFYNYSPYFYQMSKMGECNRPFIEGEDHPCAGADFIEWGSGSSGWLYKYETKAVESLIKGLEFNLNYEFNNFRISYDYSIVRGDDLTNDIPLPYINPDKHIFKIGFNKGVMDYKLRLSGNQSQNRLGEFEGFTPSFLLVDFIIGHSNNNQNFSIQLNNIFNVEYYNHLSKLKSIIPEPGRNIAINCKIFF
ncbi:MAG: TonB-dependent receptor [Candidatus Marinimicrobia bacterium]|jgi:iron complex outermembrane receptor protein|nr:TonB-dependent receptor [Candidatus Neomarinimicrobiota bacterium]